MVGQTVLIVDDSTDILEVLRGYLEDEGFAVLSTADPFEAIRLAAAHHIDMVLTDVVMPALSGPAMADLIRVKRPQLAVLLMSGYHDEISVSYPIIGKPFRLIELCQMIRDLLDYGPSQPRE